MRRPKRRKLNTIICTSIRLLLVAQIRLQASQPFTSTALVKTVLILHLGVLVLHKLLTVRGLRERCNWAYARLMGTICKHEAYMARVAVAVAAAAAAVMVRTILKD